MTPKTRRNGKNPAAILLVFAFCFVAAPILSAKQDGYDKVAEELSDSADKFAQHKAAILPFTYLDQRKSDGGMIVAERLTTRIVKLRKFQIIERQLLEKVLQELHLETSGVVDTETTKQIGKILGVDAIITGTLLDVEDGMTEINARVIKTETAEVTTTASAEVKKIWTDAGQQQQQQAPATQQTEQERNYQTPVRQTVYQPSYYKPRPSGFFDIFSGVMDATTMDITFENATYGISSADLDFINVPAHFTTLEFKKLKMEQVSGPIGIRFCGFGKNLGGDLEISYYSAQLKAQETTASFDGASPGNFTFYAKDYFKVKTINIGGDLLFRFSDGNIQPYFGVGLALSMDMVSSPYIYQFDESGSGVFNTPLDDTGFGVGFKIPVGVRVKLGDSFSFFGEWRIAANAFSFDRNIKYEKDAVTLAGSQVLLGIGFGM